MASDRSPISILGYDTLTELAEASGVWLSTLSCIYSGKRRPTLDNSLRLARASRPGMTIDEFLDWLRADWHRRGIDPETVGLPVVAGQSTPDAVAELATAV